YDAATMVHSTGSAITGGWNLWSNGYVSTMHTIAAAGQTTITVTASGSSAAGVWPHMVVSVDGAPIGSASVSSSSWSDYTFPLTATAGAHEIRVTFDNDYCSTTEDRNLYVAKLTVGCGAAAGPAPSCQAATYAAASMTHSVGG